MGLIAPGRENLLDFLEVRQVLSTYTGDLRDPLWWPQERPVPMRVSPGPFGIPVPSMTGPKIFVESVPEPEDSSPVLTWILAYFWSLPSLRQSSARVGSCTCAFLPSGSSSVALPISWIKVSVAFPRGFPTRLSHEALPQGCPTCHSGVSRSLA